MATKTKGTSSAIGSSQWIDQENQQSSQFRIQESEDFAFSVRNELDFLSEHMSEIFSRNHVNITEVFKTPGKLRGKTPRTARKRNLLGAREPLSDIFAPNSNANKTPSRNVNRSQEPAKFKVAKDSIEPEPARTAKSKTDSGYHGMSEDEMDVDTTAAAGPTSDLPQSEEEAVLMELDVPMNGRSREQSAMDGSFHSAKEDIAGEDPSETTKAASHSKQSMHPEDRPDPHSTIVSTSGPQPLKPDLNQFSNEQSVDKDSVLDEDPGNDSLRSASEGSSPAIKGLVRKSSLTFAALPPCEPFTTKKSIGSRLSRTSQLESSKGVMGQGSFLGRITGGKSLGGSRQPEAAPEIEIGENSKAERPKEPASKDDESDSEARVTKLHNKSSTQKLHERINMLGKSQPARPTKSIAAAATFPLSAYPELPAEPTIKSPPPKTQSNEDDDGDWIQPPGNLQRNDAARPQLSKSISADVMENLRGKMNISDQEFRDSSEEYQIPTRRQSLPRDSESNVPNASPSRAKEVFQKSPKPSIQTYQSAKQSDFVDGHPVALKTPTGTPVGNKHADGPLSASKLKLQSIMKSARGLFTSSSGASALAKMELKNQAQVSSISISKSADPEVDSNSYRSLQHEPQTRTPQKILANTPAKLHEGRKTRSSTEKDEREREREHIKLKLAKQREQDDQKAASYKQDQTIDTYNNPLPESNETFLSNLVKPFKSQQQPTRKSPRQLAKQPECATSRDETVDTVRESFAPRVNQLGPSSHPPQLQKPKDLKRPVKPSKDTASRPEPQRVAIRVGTLSRPVPLTNAALSSGLEESLPSQGKQQGLAKKTSTTSIQTSTSHTSLRGIATSKPKALIAAERKKEQDEKEAQRKLEQKRENERKRATQLEESRRQEEAQRQEAERQRERERAAAAGDPKKAIQRLAIEKRRQEMAKKEQQRVIPATVSQANQLTSRPELGGGRPGKAHTLQDHPRPQTNHPAPNPARPAIKRVLESEAEEPMQHHRIAGGPSYQQADVKRRRTEDEAPEEISDTLRPYNTSSMALPSMTNGYAQAKPSLASQAYQQQHQHSIQAPRPGHPPDMAKYANSKIIFAENPNPAHPSHKTPNTSRPTNNPLAKASPQYLNGENIHLEDIPTDSEDDESEDESSKKVAKAMLPAWVQSPILRDILQDQERSIDPDSVFGPSAAVNMEEMFKDRHHRFRSRTSSANWAGNDRLTEEEIRSDNAARERLRREGAWTFGL